MDRSARPRVLIADDSQEIARRVSELVRDAVNAEIVGPAFNGVEAIAYYHVSRPHAVVLDVRMPGFSGIEVVSAIRQLDHACVLVVITTHGDASVREACLNAGADAVVNKFGNLGEVAEVLRAAFGVN